MPAKSAPRNNNKRLTDFFVRRPAPALVASSSPVGSTTARASTASAVDHESPMNLSAGAGAMPTRKRARSPGSTIPTRSPLSLPKSKSARKPSDFQRPKTVISVTSPVSRQSFAQGPTLTQVHKNTLAAASPLCLSEQIVYSSQSDEAELVLPRPASFDLERVVEGVHTWRRNTFESPSSLFLHPDKDDTEVDLAPSSPSLGSPLAYVRSAPPTFDAPTRFAATPRSGPAPQTPNITSPCFPSPPDTNSLPPLPPTPEPIDSEVKTARLIAEIKARAFAVEWFSDDEQPLSYRELDDSDDDDLVDALPLIGGAKGRGSGPPERQLENGVFSSPLSSVPSIFNDVSVDSPRPIRTSARARKPASAFRLPAIVSGSSTFIGATNSPSLNRKKARPANPLHALLRERQLQERRGVGRTALRLAEEAVGQGSRESPVGSDIGEPDPVCQLRFADERAAWKAVSEFRKSTSPADTGDVVDHAARDCASKMLGAAAGEAIDRILSSDRDSKGKGRAQDVDLKTTLGVPLWMHPSDEDMDVDSAPSMPLSGHHIFACLDEFLRDGDDSLLDLILRSGALAAVPGDVLMSNIPQLLDLALFTSQHVAEAVCIALCDLWDLKPNKMQMPLAAILSALVRLGANPSVLEGLGLTVERTQKNPLSYETFVRALKRLLAIVRAAGSAGAFALNDIPNMVLILVSMGLDLLTSDELCMQLNTTVDIICNDGTADSLLNNIHDKVLSFAKRLAPVSKAQLVSFFASGSGRTRHIAQCLAYCLLVSEPTIPNHQAPPLEPLISLISPDAGSCKLFDVASESTDYEELGHYVNILSVALINIAPYVEEERAVVKSTNGASIKRSPGKPQKPPLELLRSVLEVLQSKIVDTRGAHLDRSRTKASIQRLTMRINYDRMALIGIRPRQRASTLKAYFSPQRP